MMSTFWILTPLAPAAVLALDGAFTGRRADRECAGNPQAWTDGDEAWYRVTCAVEGDQPS